MATIFNWIYLGTGALIDPTEGNTVAENASALVGLTYGSAGSPLYNAITQATMINVGGDATALDQNNTAANDQFTTDIGAGIQTFTFDASVIYNVTITYADGTTGTVTAVIAQSTGGHLFLAPETIAGSAADTAAYQLKPIVSIRLNSITDGTTSYLGLAIDRTVTGWDDGWIEGTSGGDLINASYVEPIGNGTDRIDNNDGIVATSLNDDRIRAGAGNDTVNAGLGNDLVYGGIGDDSLLGEGGHDTLYGDEGADRLFGGAGDDTLIGGDGADSLDGGTGSDQLFGGGGIDTLIGGDGADRIYGGDGADQIFGGEGADWIEGGEGNDNIQFGAGDDTVYGGGGDDTIDDVTGALLSGANLVYGGDGNDTVWTGNGNDRIYGDAGNDALYGEDGDDTLDGGIGNDVLDGGAGNDLLIAGPGRDSLYGGAGNDVLYGGTGGSLLSGGADRDTIFGGVGDTVSGDGTGDDYDTLDLTGLTEGRLKVHRDVGNPENGYVEYFDALGNLIGTLQFTDIENIIPCFTPGTRLRVGGGERAVEDIAVGDLVATRDGGLRPVTWVGRKVLSLADLVVRPELRPVLIPAGALGRGRPARDMRVSPQHRILIEGSRAEMLFGEPEVLVAAIHLCGRAGIRQELTRGIDYIHVMFETHEILSSDGIWSESFQPASRMVSGMDQAQRDEIMALFPELVATETAFASARMTLRGFEARVLLAA